VLALANPVAKLDKTARRKLIRFSIVAGNIALLVIVGSFVLYNRSASQTVRASTLSSAIASANSASNPLDTLSSAQIALTAAQITHLSELTAVRNQADSDTLILNQAPSDSSVLSKPQLVSTAQKSKQDIIQYVTVAGDSIDSVAAKYGITADSIRWSNNLKGSNVSVGVKLSIPPVNGIVYTVQAGDTPASIAKKYSADESQVIALNDAEIKGLTTGEQIIVPNGRIATASTASFSGFSASFGGLTATFGGNGYDPGWCTWYVANRRAELGNPVPNNLGNAYTWYRIAAAEGLPTGFVPKVGAVMVYEAGDHVTVVEQINDDGSFWISEMNDYGQVSIDNSRPTGGWGVRDFRLIPASQVSMYRYIY
jgi:surface antigen